MQISALYRYPVKSMAADGPLEQVDLQRHGLAGDRRAAFVRSEDRSDFPWLTIRQLPRLTLYRPRLRSDGTCEVLAPDGTLHPLDAPELRDELAESHGHPVHLMRLQRGTFDAFPVSVVSRRTIDALRPGLEPLRFRPNILLDDAHEDEFVGRTLQFGDPDADDGGAQVRIQEHDQRCMVVNFDPATAERDPSVLRAVAQQRGNCLGVYGTVVRPGILRAGMSVTVL